MAPPVSPRSDVPPVAAAPTVEEMWGDYDRLLEEIVLPEEKARLLAEKKEAEEKEAER